MESPLCKLCGERHRLGFCPKFRKAKPQAILQVATDNLEKAAFARANKAKAKKTKRKAK